MTTHQQTFCSKLMIDIWKNIFATSKGSKNQGSWKKRSTIVHIAYLCTKKFVQWFMFKLIIRIALYHYLWLTPSHLYSEQRQKVTVESICRDENSKTEICGSTSWDLFESTEHVKKYKYSLIYFSICIFLEIVFSFHLPKPLNIHKNNGHLKNEHLGSHLGFGRLSWLSSIFCKKDKREERQRGRK